MAAASTGCRFQIRAFVVTNVAPVIQTFSLTSSSNFHNEGSVQMQATATDANGDAISYQFTVQSTVVSAWSTNRAAAWLPGVTNFGSRVFTVAVRDPLLASNQLSQVSYIFSTPPRP